MGLLDDIFEATGLAPPSPAPAVELAAVPGIEATARGLIQPELARQAGAAGALPAPNATAGSPWRQVVVQLAELSTTDASKSLNLPGRALIYRKLGSVPGGLLVVDQGGGRFASLAPGERLEAQFEGLRLGRVAGSCATGPAALVVVSQDGADFVEPATPAAARMFDPVPLMNGATSLAVGTFDDPVTLSAAPNGNGTMTGSFDSTGFRRFLVGVRFNGSCTAVSLRAWVFEPVVGVWVDMGDLAAVQLAPVIVGGLLYAFAELEFSWAGRAYVQPYGWEPSTVTSSGLVVWGVA